MKRYFEKREVVKWASTRLLADRFTLSQLSDFRMKVDRGTSSFSCGNILSSSYLHRTIALNGLSPFSSSL